MIAAGEAKTIRALVVFALCIGQAFSAVRCNMIEWFRRNFPQDDFSKDWYGYLTNQVSHVGLGLFMATFVAIGFFVVAGEMPGKWAAWVVCFATYMAMELVRGWNGWDSVEDTIFTAGYGAGGAFLLFSEVTPGDPVLSVDIVPAGVLAAVMVLHLILGVARRW